MHRMPAIFLLGLQSQRIQQPDMRQLRRGKGLGRVCLCAGRRYCLGRYP
jgi:hypothetical protein